MKKQVLIIVAFCVAVVFFIVLLPAISRAGGVVPLENIERPVWNIGDTWKYQVVSKDGSTVKKFVKTLTVKEKDAEGYLVFIESEVDRVFYRYSLNLNFVEAKDEKGTKLENANPEIPTYQWPISVKSKWWKKDYFFSEGLDSGNFSVTGEVTGAETLIDAEGKEIATIRVLEKRDNQWGRFYQRNHYWLNPSVKNCVKYIRERTRDRREEGNLISFTPGPK